MEMEDNRPIKPDPKYIQQYLQKIKTVQTKAFLKKKSNPTLPCFAYKQTVNHSQPKQPIQRNTKTKAAIYEQIKSKNKRMFGQKPTQSKHEDREQKKINPKKMTVDFKHKKIIQIDDYKKKDRASTMAKEVAVDNKDKIEYQKLLDYFHKQLTSLEQQKEQFRQVASKLQFKQAIRTEQPLLYTQARAQVQKQLANSKVRSQATSPINHSHTQNIPKSINQPNRESFSKTLSVGEIQQKLGKTTQQIKLLKSQLLSPNMQVKEYKYQISQVYLLPNFQPKTVYQYIDPSKLKFNANKHYQSAIKAYHSKFHKQNKECENMDDDQPCRQSVQQKVIGEKRVRKYEGWTEVWIPGKQRVMANKDNYKIVWLSNGDVIQDFGNHVKTYYSKVKAIDKIQYKDCPPIYYHQSSRQIWRYLQDGSREVVYANGRQQIIEKGKDQ